MSNELLPHIEINPANPPIASVIWLHGLGADGHDFEPIVPELKLPEDNPVRFILPHAPKRPVTINGGMSMPAWYDIKQQWVADLEGIAESTQQLQSLIESEIERGFNPQQIILAGFSQGGVIALNTGLTYPKTLGGLVALSTYLPQATTLADQLGDANRGVSIFQAHGSMDVMIPINIAQSAFERLKAWGYHVDYKEYTMAHQVCVEEITDLRNWLIKRLEFINSNLTD